LFDGVADQRRSGRAFRVSTLDVSVVDLTCRLETSIGFNDLCETIKTASKGEYKGIVAYTEEDVVSSDFITTNESCIFDKKASIALNDHFFKLIAWYDNEWAYSRRVCDLVVHAAKEDQKVAAK
jgi:glyceraldehyde 3-phosphate dehydrogenase